MGIFSRKSEASRSQDKDIRPEVFKKERERITDRNSNPERPFYPKKLPEGLDAGLVYYENGWGVCVKPEVFRGKLAFGPAASGKPR